MIDRQDQAGKGGMHMGEPQSGASDRPWETEPNRLEWKSYGFTCLITRHPDAGHLCGYVAVPKGHPWYGVEYGKIDARVHGGLTYSEKCRDKVCHVVPPGEDDDVWWIGFDCAHAYDISPYMEERMKQVVAMTSGPMRKQLDELMSKLPAHFKPKYRTIDYVKAEVEKLAIQAQAAGASRVIW